MRHFFLRLTRLALFCIFIVTPFAKAATSSCPQALVTDNPNFCSSFKEAAICHCTSMGLPINFCQDLKALNARMLSMFGSLERACAFQKNTSQQTCMDDWNCYLNGGEDSNGRLCTSTGDSCE